MVLVGRGAAVGVGSASTSDKRLWWVGAGNRNDPRSSWGTRMSSLWSKILCASQQEDPAFFLIYVIRLKQQYTESEKFELLATINYLQQCDNGKSHFGQKEYCCSMHITAFSRDILHYSGIRKQQMFPYLIRTPLFGLKDGSY